MARGRGGVVSPPLFGGRVACIWRGLLYPHSIINHAKFPNDQLAKQLLALGCRRFFRGVNL